MGTMNQFIVFKLASEEFGVEINKVQEILKPQPVTKLPQAAGFIEGITNLRGDIITIIDLRKRLDFPLNDQGEDRILVVKINDIDVGFVVDDASEVIRIEEEQIAAPKKGIAGIKTEYLEGIAKLKERLIIILDLDKILSTEDQIKIEEIAENHQ
ncbi:purine-binding chemotaxis protein CheW [Orenia metallireducens]|jgi:purine-binding chemotaxis protein CheW|uniref:Purine-binding chemotaxis protein CheW n=1 Tax=Orenia metallireducens TaxID=1413210 RepID=A0A285FW43_9FIRM|nr:chemotaxis protein CheW [Orenia metallireducens]PRX35644.1 purine-binding chemotaxis protein CheW [Orenia metallireducens]SNY15532.1 purine-binding chemotaxis protein CheW [Orenia metallireducens]